MSKIYIVEDDDAIRTELALALEHNGYEALACTTFDHVVDDVLEASPDLVLLDLSLPQTDGQFICRELRSHSDVPIIVLTSRATEVDEVMSMTLGAETLFPSPIACVFSLRACKRFCVAAPPRRERLCCDMMGLSSMLPVLAHCTRARKSS